MRSTLIGKKFKVYQGDKLEDIGIVEEVEIYYGHMGEAYCIVRFPDGTKYRRWVRLANEVREEE
jgi:hypothetical protein